MKNILILTQELYPDKIGGSAKVAWQQAKTFANLKYNVTIITNGGNNETKVSKNMQIIEYTGNRYKSLTDLKQGKEAIKKITDSIDFDLAIIHHPYIGKAFLSLRKNIPYIYMFHASTALETKYQGLDLENRNKALGKIIKPFYIKYTKYIENELLLKAKQIWAFSNFSEMLIKKHFNRIGSKIKQIPYLADLETFKPEEDRNSLRNNFNIQAKDIIAITVRRLVPRMGLEWLIKSFPAIIKKHPHIKLLIIGNGYLKNELNSLIQELKLGDKVLLLGRLPESTLINYYKAADIFILPTLAYEGLGLSTIEALSCGMPVIGTNIGATPEILNGIDKNLLLQNLDSVALMNCIDYTLLNKKELVIKTRKFCEDNYDQKKSQVLANLLEEALK
ncbi:glycosyltransferase family 4 protein [Patescibacteria group bacterium]|nr:glycosyltransferase family 4 protein [Patescibacteria group bacterium]